MFGGNMEAVQAFKTKYSSASVVDGGQNSGYNDGNVNQKKKTQGTKNTGDCSLCSIFHILLQERMIMITFNGYLTGNAQKHFIKRSRELSQKIILFSFCLLLPPMIFFASSSNFQYILHIYFSLIVVAFLATFLPQGKKTKISMTPKKIYIEEDRIVCIADKYEEMKSIKDVKKLYDYGEFYEFVFPFGKLSEKFICQKELLAEGSIDEFESLFEGKIVRKKNTGDG